MNVLVTGATGFIGSHLCKELIRRGHYVVALAHIRKTDNIKNLLQNRGFHLETGDIQNADMIHSLIRDNSIETVFHLAAQLPGEGNVNNPFLYFDTNARGTLNILNAAYLYGVSRFIYASTISVYSEPPQSLPVEESHPVKPTTIYGVAKLTGELYGNAYAKTMNTMTLRFSGAYGKNQRVSDAIPTFIRQALADKPLTVDGDGTQTSDFVYIDDVIQGALLAWEMNKPGVYNIGSSEETSVRELAERIISITSSKSEVVLTGKDTERPFRFFLDITRARGVLGYSPRSLEEGLCRYLKEFNIEV